MRGNMLLDQMELVDPAYVEAADVWPQRKRGRSFVRRGAAAACLCLLAAGVYGGFWGSRGNRVQSWREGYTAERYFRYCSRGEESAGEDKIMEEAYPYTQTRWFSDWRRGLEEDQAIPVLESHPLFYAMAHYYSDGGLYSVELSWQRRDAEDSEELTRYSDLTVTVGYEEISIIEDCIDVRAQSAVTITEREGVLIVAKGLEDTKKTLTYQTEHGWYQISGSWNDDYETVVELLDWFWQHPLDLSRFALEEGDLYTVCTLAQQPDAFLEELPDFAGLGFVEQDTAVSLKNGTPVEFQGHYAYPEGEETEAGAVGQAEEGAEAVDGMDVDRMHWCITREPGFYDLKACIGDLRDLTLEQITQVLGTKSNLKFRQGECVVTVYAKNPQEAWLLIESLQKGGEE